MDYTITDVIIANQALQLLGDARTVTSVSADSSAIGVLVAALYNATRDEELKAWGWVFAVKRAALTVGAAPTNGYIKQYTLTAASISDCLRPLDVYVALANTTQYGSYALTQTQRLGFIFDSSGGPTGVIYTMIDPGALTVYLKYIAEITAAASFDGLFAEALSIRLADKMSLYITRGQDWKDKMKEEYQFVISRAKEMNIIEELDNDLGNPWFGDRRAWDPMYENKDDVPKIFMDQMVSMTQKGQQQ